MAGCAKLWQLTSLFPIYRNIIHIRLVSCNLHRHSPFVLCRKLSVGVPVHRLQSASSSDINLDSLSQLSYLQLKALAKTVGLPANQKKDKILKMLLAHFD